MGHARRRVEPRHVVPSTVFVLSNAKARLACEPLVAGPAPNESQIRGVVAGELKLMRRRKAHDRAMLAARQNRPVTNLDGRCWRRKVVGPLLPAFRINPGNLLP